MGNYLISGNCIETLQSLKRTFSLIFQVNKVKKYLYNDQNTDLMYLFIDETINLVNKCNKRMILRIWSRKLSILSYCSFHCWILFDEILNWIELQATGIDAGVDVNVNVDVDVVCSMVSMTDKKGKKQIKWNHCIWMILWTMENIEHLQTIRYASVRFASLLFSLLFCPFLLISHSIRLFFSHICFSFMTSLWKKISMFNMLLGFVYLNRKHWFRRETANLPDNEKQNSHIKPSRKKKSNVEYWKVLSSIHIYGICAMCSTPYAVCLVPRFSINVKNIEW